METNVNSVDQRSEFFLHAMRTHQSNKRNYNVHLKVTDRVLEI